MVASGAGTAAGLLWATFFHSARDVSWVCNCLLGALVAITGPSGFVDLWAAIVVGVLAVPVLAGSSAIVTHVLKIDDPIDAISVHASCGFLGIFWLGLADPTYGLFYTGQGDFFGLELLGAACIFGWGVLNSLAFFGLAKLVMIKRGGISYPHDEQLVGLDFVYFGGSAYPDLDLEITGAQLVNMTAQKNAGRRNGSFVQNGRPAVLSMTPVRSATPTESGSRPVTPEPSSMPRVSSQSSIRAVTSDDVTATDKAERHQAKHKTVNFNSNALDLILADDVLRKRFRQFLFSLHCDENVRFYDAVLARQVDPIAEFRATSARAIVLMFIVDDAPKQINLAGAVRRDIIAAFGENNREELSKRNFFEKALMEMYNDIRQSPSFKEFLQSIFGAGSTGGTL
jgi:hypothetical protein